MKNKWKKYQTDISSYGRSYRDPEYVSGDTLPGEIVRLLKQGFNIIDSTLVLCKEDDEGLCFITYSNEEAEQ